MEKVLQFITDGTSTDEIINQVTLVLEGGCRWIQLRMKDFATSEIERVIEHARPLCKESGAILIMNDRVDIAARYNLDGVHLGRSDMSVCEARQILGDDAIIGITANTIEDIIESSQDPMSYFGIGPMRYTTTKKNLKPVIGLSGYHDIVSAMRQTGVNKPAVAVGGIRPDDVYDLLETGLWGVAISGAIAHAADIKAATIDIMNIIKRYND